MAASRIAHDEIAITGLACRFADASGPAAFWKNIMERRAAFTPFEDSQPISRFAPTPLFDRPFPSSVARLDALYGYNPNDQFFPRKVTEGENQDVFFAVQLAIDALRDSAMAIESLPTDRVSLRLGYAPPFNAASVNWLQHAFFLNQTMDVIHAFFPHADPSQIAEIRADLSASLPPPNPYAFISAYGCSLAAWTAHLLGFAGPAYVIDAGGVSGPQALQSAVDDLQARRADIALAGAIQPPLNRAVLEGLSGSVTFSRGKTLQPFSRDADGTLPGEGGAFFVLKRLRDARRQNDRIYALVRGIGIAAASADQQQHALSPERLTRAISRALHEADAPPATVALIEAHGSGVPCVDRAELNVLQDIYGDRASGASLTGIGTVKGNIGHTLWAAGAAGLFKAALALYHRVLPPNVPVDRPYPELLAAHAPLYLLGEARPWICGRRATPRRACVSVVDFTGTCASVLLEALPDPA